MFKAAEVVPGCEPRALKTPGPVLTSRCQIPGAAPPQGARNPPEGRLPRQSRQTPSPVTTRARAQPGRSRLLDGHGPTLAPLMPWDQPGTSPAASAPATPASLTTKGPLLLSLQKLWLLRGPVAAGLTCRRGGSLSGRAHSLPRSLGDT